MRFYAVKDRHIQYIKRPTDALLFCRCNFIAQYKGKGKAVPLQAWTGPEGSMSLRLLDFKTIGT